MNAVLKYLSLLLLPFMIMIIVNESCRLFAKGTSHNYLGATAINSAIYDINNCTWACHNSTESHCIEHHTKIIQPGFPFYNQVNAFYEEIINFNSRKVSGRKVSDPHFYTNMNLLFLLVLWPLLMYLLVINYFRLKKLSKTNDL